MLEKLLREIDDLKKSKKLLEDIWLELGPYNNLPDDLKNKLNNYFNFDDSE